MMPLPAPRKAAALCALLWLTGAASAGSLRVQVLDSAGKPLEGAVVSLVSDAARRAVRPLPEQEISQENKQFVPAVRVVTVGTLVRFPNRDSVRHHVYSFSPAKKFEIKLYAGTPAAPVLFDQPGVAVLGCNIHDQMVGWVVVLDTPYFAQTDAQGQALLEGMPAGAHQLRAWHARLPVDVTPPQQAIALTEGDSTATVRLGGLQP
ncbi:methylamine utilization protein [Acidovorax sp. 210-6]|jgi:plastocyanin|uniref:methylamine utilization protein n=1 Tax=Acidovorax sp. 210-6 TaxID=2699468 RepID=UPI00138975C3|nr:methylamine utilization protein [Acidovorax sp. 210-6]MBL8365892.1 methylamine utilization protein [Comamonas sp.]NCU67562.1 methylamine utilization protein [Acidovorax sp. 210-6]